MTRGQGKLFHWKAAEIMPKERYAGSRKGGYKDMAKDLKQIGLIHSCGFFKLCRDGFNGLPDNEGSHGRGKGGKNSRKALSLISQIEFIWV